MMMITVGGAQSKPEREDLEEDHYYDQYINYEVLLLLNGVLRTGKVTNRKRDSDGDSIGRANKHTTCDTSEYIVQFPDGSEAKIFR